MFLNPIAFLGLSRLMMAYTANSSGTIHNSHKNHAKITSLVFAKECQIKNELYQPYDVTSEPFY